MNLLKKWWFWVVLIFIIILIVIWVKTIFVTVPIGGPGCGADGTMLSDMLGMGYVTKCCEGLNTISPFYWDEERGECGFYGEGGICTSTECGDGVCEDPEDICNCEEDCMGDYWIVDDIHLMQHPETMELGCFGCNSILCVDPSPEMVGVEESSARHCDDSFNIIWGED
ncbi:hypothetical protein HOC06_01350 [Candidatus Woesearchaeota archaeon]|jgi:hypothetical protein|nr:hypothetical protein [Candidatus Woesearchaeota archaeon]MBT4630851.1 hypothetical protein [Candidatus Woesearchaeota archaeon]